MAFTLTEAQAAAVENRGGGLLVSAAAGSGKTRVLVERLVGRVEHEGLDIDRFLVITYTKAAAAELRGRIGKELAERLARDPSNAHLRRQQTLVYKAQISTIHSFCGQLLRECGHLIDQSPDFHLADEGEAGLLMLRALDDVLERRYEHLTEGDDFALLVDTMSAGRDDSKLVQIVLDMRGRIQSHPDPAAWLDAQERAFSAAGITDAGQTPWGALLLEDARRQGAYWLGKMKQAQRLCACDPILKANYAATLAATADGLEAFLAAARESWDAAVGALPIPFDRAGGRKGTECLEEAEQVKSLRSRCKKRLEKLTDLLDDTSEGLLEDMAAVYPAVRALFALVKDCEEAYRGEKTRRNLLDFSDLEHLAVRLLVGENGTQTALAEQQSQRFDEIMVDEYQDTNAVQNAIFTALSRGGRNLFMVGDVKQSVYRFRLADPTIFLGKYRAFQPYTQAEDGAPRRIILSKNFRSRPTVLEGANFVFRNIMSTEFGEMEYTPDDALYPGADYPEDVGGAGALYATELDAIDLSAAGEEESEKTPRDLMEARFVAERISGLLEEGFPVADGEGALRPARCGDIVILLRSPGAVLHHYARALGERNLPWEADGGDDFFAATEVAVALALLQVVDNPRQDVALLSVLRSPVYAFSADRLAVLRAACPTDDFYTALVQGARAEDGADCRRFLAELSDLRRQAVDKNSHRLLWHIYDRTNLLGIFGALDEGETRQGNLLALCALAQQFEDAGHKGLFGFLTYLTRLRESGGKIAVPRQGRDGGGVRIMSIHRSKGLEFPIVFLSGLMRRLNRDDMQRPILFHPVLGVGPKRLDTGRMVEYTTLPRRAVGRKLEYEMMAEELRLLYVAMTRAREKLILTCALTRGGAELQKLAEDAGCPTEPQALAACGSVGQWVLLPVLCRPEALTLRAAAGCTLVPPSTDYGPAWDIRWVDGTDYACAPDGRAALPRPPTAETLPADLAARLTWVYPHESDVEIPSKLTATQLKGRQVDEEVMENARCGGQDALRAGKKKEIRRPRFADEAFGLTPTQKGTALHLVMQYIDFGCTGSVSAVEGEIARLTEQQFLTPPQGAAVDPKKIYAFFASPVGRALLASGTLKREFKFSILVPAGDYYPRAGEGERVLLQGVVDCYFETADGITVVDFKTDRVTEADMALRAEAYRPQLLAYSRALEEVVGRPVKRRILWFFAVDGAAEITP